MVDEKTLQQIADQASRLMAAGWRGNPNMSGDDRDFMHDALRRRHDDKVRAVVDFVLSQVQALSPGSTGETEGWREGKPPNDSTVLVVCAATPKNNAFAGRRDVLPIYVGPDGKFDPDPTNEFWRVTHWRPLPAPPSAMLSAAGER